MSQKKRKHTEESEQLLSQEVVASSREEFDDFVQSINERRTIRKKYRHLIQTTTASRLEMIRPESDSLQKAVNKGDTFYQRVKNPREAVLDSEFMSITSQYGAEQARALQTGFKAFEPLDFINAVKHRLSGRNRFQENENEENEEDPREYNWTSFGRMALHYCATAPLLHFMYGSLNIEHLQKKERKKTVREKDSHGKTVVPEQVDAGQVQVQKDNETTKCVEIMKKHLEKAGDTNMLQFVLNPDSYGQTIENLFHLSFLVQDGQAALHINETGLPVARPAQPPVQADYDSGKARRKQCIVRFDYKAFQEMKNTLHKGSLPKRKPGNYAYNK